MGILLSKPNKEKSLEKGDDEKYVAFGCAAMQGWRTGMEDAHATVMRLPGDDSRPPKSFFAVYDGHGGFEVAIFASRHVHEILAASEKYKSGDIGGAMEEAYITVDDMMLEENGLKELQVIQGVYANRGGGPILRRDSTLVGCTAVSCVIDFDNRAIICANAGDSRCVVSEAGQAVRLSEDHKPQLPSEEKRITAAGGHIANGRVNGNLNLTRSLGDHQYKQNKSLTPAEQIISCVPDIKKYDIKENSDFVILGCDGIWDVMRDQEAVNFVHMRLLPRACLTEEEKQLPTISNIQRDVRFADYEDPTSDLTQWPGDVATSLDDLLMRTASQLVDKCLAPATSCIIGCDNMSACVVLLRESAFAKRVIEALEERLKNSPPPKEPEAQPEGEAEKKPEESGPAQEEKPEQQQQEKPEEDPDEMK